MTPAEIIAVIKSDGLLAAYGEYKRRTGKAFMAAFSLDQINEILSGAGIQRKELRPMTNQSQQSKDMYARLDRIRGMINKMAGRAAPTNQSTYVDVTTEDLMRRKVTREVEADDPIIEGLVQEIESQAATIADLMKRVEALEKPTEDATEDAERQRQTRNDGTLEGAFGLPPTPAPAQVQRQTTHAPSSVFGDLFTGSPAPTQATAPVKKERSMFDPLFRNMDVPVRRQTQQAQPNTIESLTRRKG